MEFLTSLTSTLSTKVGTLLPGILGALAVLIIGLILAMIVRRIILGIFKRTNIDERIGKNLSMDFRVDRFISNLGYYLVVIYTLLLVLDMMGVESVLTPLENMLNEFLSFLPNLIAAGIIGFAGYIIAQLASEATGFVSKTLENLSTRLGWTGSISLTRIVKQLVFLFVFIPILVVALDTLKMDAISKPATEMLQSFMSAIPNILSAALILAVFYIAGRYVVTMLTELLQNVGLDQFSNRLGVTSMIGQSSLSRLIGNVAFFFLMFTGIIAASDKLNLGEVNAILQNIFTISGQVFFGIAILAAGSFISNLVSEAMLKSSTNAWMAPVARFAIIGIFLAFALHTMGIAESIVNLAFGLTLGAIAVAFALSFGLGGREAAGKEMERFFKRLRER